jgi:iron complex outermembrane receptor protein
MIDRFQRQLAGGVSGLALVMALGGVAHADDVIATAGGAAAPAAAGVAGLQAAAPQAADDTAVTEVVVTGFRNSLQRALELKRTSTGVVDSILAEDIAKFPDNNLAESIQRIPGVAISRDQGEGRALSVRGLGPDFTRVRINGMEAQASTDGYSGANRGRGFDFNVFASELFNRIDVRKTPSADVEEGSLGATVDLTTGHPFDYKGFKLAASAQAGYNDQTRQDPPAHGAAGQQHLRRRQVGRAVLGGLFEDGRRFPAVQLGPVEPGQWRRRLVQADHRHGRHLRRAGGRLRQGHLDLQPGQRPHDLLSALHALRAGLGKTERLGLTGSLQWAPDDDTKVTLDGLFSRYKVSRDDWPLEAIGFSRGASQGGKPEMVVRDMILDSQQHHALRPVRQCRHALGA